MDMDGECNEPNDMSANIHRFLKPVYINTLFYEALVSLSLYLSFRIRGALVFQMRSFCETQPPASIG